MALTMTVILDHACAAISATGSEPAAWQQSRLNWRHYTPAFDLKMVKQSMALRLDKLLSGHVWSRNRFISKLRRDGADLKRYKKPDGTWHTKIIAPRRASIRQEREQTLDALTRAMIYRASYDPDAPYLFEVKASVEELARMIGQLHEYQPAYDGNQGQYRHGRKSYDPVLGALEDMAAAELIVLVTEFDKQAKMYKARRIFFTPNFFKGFGLTMSDTKAMLNASRKFQEKYGLLPSAKKKRQAEVLRLCDHDRVAGLNNHALKNLLARFKREFTGANKHTEQVRQTETHIKQALKDAANARKNPPRHPNEQRLFELSQLLPRVQVILAEKAIKLQTAQTYGPEYQLALIALLETYT